MAKKKASSVKPRLPRDDLADKIHGKIDGPFVSAVMRGFVPGDDVDRGLVNLAHQLWSQSRDARDREITIIELNRKIDLLERKLRAACKASTVAKKAAEGVAK